MPSCSGTTEDRQLSHNTTATQYIDNSFSSLVQHVSFPDSKCYMFLTIAEIQKWKQSPYPTVSARQYNVVSDIITWQAKRCSSGCLVIKPKYLPQIEQWQSATLVENRRKIKTTNLFFDDEIENIDDTYLLCFGWQPQNEMFFNWKKWKHCSPCRKRELVFSTSRKENDEILTWSFSKHVD